MKLPKIFRRLLPARKNTVRRTEIRVDSADDAMRALDHSPAETLRFLLPAHLVCMHGAYRFAGGWHPFVSALSSGVGELADFYRRFRPANLAEMYCMETRGLAGESLPPWTLPWLPVRGNTPAAEMGLSLDHGVSYFGPVTETKLRLEQKRLDDTLASIARAGYDPDSHSDITGWFMRRGDETRFFVRGGKHRAAVLAHLGFERIPVVIREAGRPLLDARDAGSWAPVLDAHLDRGLAAEIFDRYFDWTGTRQREIFTAKTIA